MIDLLYLCHGRLEFTQATLPTLIENTDWDLVGTFAVYNDAAPDGAATRDYLKETIAGMPQATYRQTNLGSPVGVMNHFLHRCGRELFAKIDNDIVVPPGWLPTMKAVMDGEPDLELLGAEPEMSKTVGGIPGPGYVECSHIGGVGLMRREVFERFPRPVPDGRFGFTEWQHTYQPRRAWIDPDLMLFSLDKLPLQPWKRLTRQYEKDGLNRAWQNYPRNMSHYWDWWVEQPDE